MTTTFWIQFLGVIFGSAMLYFTFVKFKRKEITSLELMAWFAVWIILIAVAVVPSSLDFIIGQLNFYRRLDFFVVFGFFVLLALGYYNYGRTRQMEKKLQRYVQHQAIREGQRENKDHEDKNSEDN